MNIKWYWRMAVHQDVKWHDMPPLNIFDMKDLKTFDRYYAANHILIEVLQEGTIEACLTIAGHYQFCCGLREIGAIEINGDPATIAQYLHDNLCDGIYAGIGALTYTEVKDKYDSLVYGEEVSEFLKAWPNGEAGPWWYNPNSGNTVRIWTLPINQDNIPTPEDIEDDEEW